MEHEWIPAIPPPPDKLLDTYYVTFRSQNNDYRRCERYAAESFAHAEEQAKETLELGEDIIQIEMDYKQ